MSPKLTQLLAEMTPQEQIEVEAFAAFLIVRRQIMYHPQSGWFDEGPQRGPRVR
jgi:hypothetical protein